MQSHKGKVLLAKRLATPEVIKASGGLFKTHAWVMRRTQKEQKFRARVERMRAARAEKEKQVME